MAEELSSAVSSLRDLDAGIVETCGEYVTSHTASLKDAVRAGVRGIDVAARYAQMFDGLLGSLCCASRAAQLRRRELGRVALVAVGGYGRRLVGPHSDVDVLFLADDPSDERIAHLAEGVLYPLWDAGVQIGHAVRGVEETLDLSKSDIRTSTTLLDMRHIAGDRSLVMELAERGRKEIFDTELDSFIEALETDTLSRHERYGGTLFLREPEIKQIESFDTPLAHFAIECNSHARAAYKIQTSEDGICLPDPVAMCVALDPTVATEWSDHHIDVETQSELTRGMTVVDRLNVAGDERNRSVWAPALHGPKAKVCWRIDNRRWKDALFAALRQSAA